jgi:hypothetical protein
MEEENKNMTLDEYIAELIKITSEHTGIPIDIIKVNREEVKKWYDDGIPAYFCFREEYN